MDQEMQDQSLLPSQPQYAQMRARHRPSPKGEQRLWLYQCAVKSCSKGEMKISGTSRPKGRDVPSCVYCGGKMHWKGTERDPNVNGSGGGNGGVGPSSNDSLRASPGVTASSIPRSGTSISTGSTSPPSQGEQQNFVPSSSFTSVAQNPPAAATASTSAPPPPPPPSPPVNSIYGQNTIISTSNSMQAATTSSNSSTSAENRGGRPWEL